MGDRSNILFRSGRNGIGVYAHWAGEAMADAAMKVLKSKAFKERLGDPDYAMRIGVQIVLETLGASSKEDTGFGLWTIAGGPGDNGYRWTIIDVDTGEIFVADKWNKPKPGDRVTKVTVAELRRRMRGQPPKPKLKPAGRRRARR
jgi:hypothetical protein